METQGYLKLGELVRSVHETPEGGWIMCTNKQTIDFSKLLRSDRKSLVTLAPLFTVNRTAMDLLKRCNGTLTVDEVKAEMATEYGASVSAVEEALQPFVREAFKARHLDVTFYKDPQKIRVTGSSQYYYPVHTCLEVTSRCNFRCKYCYRSADYAGASPVPDFELTTDQALEILEKLAHAGVGTIELTGGEPLLHPGIMELIKYCGDHFNLCALLTNGSTVTEKTAKAMADAGNFVVGISIDGPNEQIVNESSGCRNAFARVRRGFELLAQHEIVSRAAMTVTPETVDYIEDTLNLAKELHASGFAASPLMVMGRAREMSDVNEQYYGCYTHRWRKLLKDNADYIVKGTEAGRQHAERCGNCGAGYRSIVVGPNGDVRPCLVNCDKWSVMGNLLSQDLDEICASPKIRFFRDLHWPDTDTCGDCDQLWYCGRCSMRGISTALESRPDCKWAEKFRVWDWISPADTGVQTETGGCSRAYLRKAAK